MYIQQLLQNQSVDGIKHLQTVKPEPLEPQGDDQIREMLKDMAKNWASDAKPPQHNLPQTTDAKLELQSTRYLGVWTYPEASDTCAICRTELQGPCVNCEGDLTEIDCKTSFGTCKHGYHSHCINQWVEQRASCPICQQKWELLHEEDPLE